MQIWGDEDTVHSYNCEQVDIPANMSHTTNPRSCLIPAWTTPIETHTRVVAQFLSNVFLQLSVSKEYSDLNNKVVATEGSQCSVVSGTCDNIF